MKNDSTTYCLIGLAFGFGLGSMFGNVGLGAMLGMLAGFILSTVGVNRRS